MGQKYTYIQAPKVEKIGGSFQLPQNSRRGLKMKRERGKGGKKHLVQDFILDFNVKGTLLGIFTLATKLYLWLVFPRFDLP